VNSYINKGKTYHTADKDLREDAEQIDELDQKTLKSYINKSIKTGRADDSKGAHNLYKATSKVARNQATSTLKKKVSNLRYTPIAKHKNPFEYEASRDELGNRKVSEEADINELFEMQLVGTDEYRKHAIAMTPGQGEPVDAFPVKSPHRTAAENVNQQMSRMETEVTAIFENSLNSEKKPKKKTAKTMESKQNQRSQQSTKKVH